MSDSVRESEEPVISRAERIAQLEARRDALAELPSYGQIQFMTHLDEYALISLLIEILKETE